MNGQNYKAIHLFIHTKQFPPCNGWTLLLLDHPKQPLSSLPQIQRWHSSSRSNFQHCKYKNKFLLNYLIYLLKQTREKEGRPQLELHTCPFLLTNTFGFLMSHQYLYHNFGQRGYGQVQVVSQVTKGVKLTRGAMWVRLEVVQSRHWPLKWRGIYCYYY